jgi:hypothetical protein
MRFRVLSLSNQYVFHYLGLDTVTCSFALHNLAIPIPIDIRTQISLENLFLGSSTACKVEEDDIVRHITLWKRDGGAIVVSE